MSCSFASTGRGDGIAKAKLPTSMELVAHKLGLLTQSTVAGSGRLAELHHFARLGKTFPVGWWVGGW